jgi:hypothetical protein
MVIGILGTEGVGKSLTAKIIQYLTTDWDKLISEYKDLKKESFSDYLNHGWNYSEISKWQIKKFATGVNECYKIITGIDFHALDRKEKEKERASFASFAETCKKLFGKDVWAKKEFENYISYNIIKHKTIPEVKDLLNGEYVETESKWIFDDVRFYEEIEEIKKRQGILIEITKGESRYNADYVIVNNNYLEDLISKIRKVLIKMKIV